MIPSIAYELSVSGFCSGIQNIFQENLGKSDKAVQSKTTSIGKTTQQWLQLHMPKAIILWSTLDLPVNSDYWHFIKRQYIIFFSGMPHAVPWKYLSSNLSASLGYAEGAVENFIICIDVHVCKVGIFCEVICCFNHSIRANPFYWAETTASDNYPPSFGPLLLLLFIKIFLSET